MNDANELRALLAHHMGGGSMYRYALNKQCLYSEGVLDFANNAGGGAHWLLDIVFTEPQILRAMQREGFVIVELVVEASKARLSVRRDVGDPESFSRFIAHTDCPDGTWKFYFTDSVLMLPREY